MTESLCAIKETRSDVGGKNGGDGVKEQEGKRKEKERLFTVHGHDW